MLLRKYGYAWLTLGFFLGSFLLHWYFGWQAFGSEAAEHGQAPVQAEYLDQMLRDTFENWQSEFLQVFVFILLTTILMHRKSHESPDADDATEATLRRIEARLTRLEQELTGR